MLTTALVLAAVAAGCLPASAALAAARWPRRSPAAAIVLWQALGLGWGLAAVGALIGAGAAGRGPVSGIAAGGLAQAAVLLRGGAAAAGSWSLLGVLRAVSLLAGLALLLLLCWVLVAAFAAVIRARQRQRTLLSLLAHGDPKVPGALVVDHPAAAAYCVPGLRSAIVISAGALDLLDQAELAAVLAHERAHLRERHDLVLLPFTALLLAFRWSGAACRAHRTVALLVEMHADDRALRQRPARELATALLRVGAAGGGQAPSGALAVASAGPGPDLTAGPGSKVARPGSDVAGGPGPDVAAGHGPDLTAGPGPEVTTRPGSGGTAGPGSDVAARVIRLLRPAPGLPAAALLLVCATAAAIVVVPATLLLLPF